jgi:hypothetical protein
MILDLTDEETDALARLLRRTIDDDRYPLSPRAQTLKAKRYAPPRATTARRRRSALTLNPEPGSPMTLGSAAATHMRFHRVIARLPI